MELSVAKFEDGVYYFTGSKWSPKTHVGRVSMTSLGNHATYDRTGKLLGHSDSVRMGRQLLVDSLAPKK